MSQEDVEIIRRWVEGFNRADIEACMELAHPQAEVDVSRAAGPYAGVYRDREAIRGLLEGYFDAWESLVWQPERFIQHDNGCIIMPFVVSGRGAASGIPVETRAAVAWTVRDQKVIRMQLFDSEHEALEAVGLSE
jgi:ketosteroid isomerase-like protein